MNTSLSNKKFTFLLFIFFINNATAQIRELILPQGHDYFVSNVDVDSKGKNLLSGGKNGEAYLWDVRSNLPFSKIPGFRWDIMVSKFINDSVFICGGEEGKLLIYNINHLEDYTSIDLPEQGVVMAGDIDPSRKFIAFILFDNSENSEYTFSLCIVNLESLEIVFQQGIENENLATGKSSSLFTDLKFSEDGKNIISTEGSYLFHWRRIKNSNKFEYVNKEIENKKISASFYSPEFVLTIDSKDAYWLYNLNSTEVTLLKVDNTPANMVFESYHPESGYLTQLFSDSLRLYNTKTKKEMYRIATGHNRCYGFKTAPALNLIFSYDMNGEIKKWNYLTGTQISEYKPHSGDVPQLFFSKQEQLLISGNQDGKVRFWDLKKMELKDIVNAGNYDKSLGTGHMHGIIGLSLDETSGLMVCTSDNLTLRVLNYKTGVLVDSFSFADVPNDVHLIASKDLLFVNLYSSVEVYQLSTHTKLKEFEKKSYWNYNTMQYEIRSPVSHFAVDSAENTIYISNADGNYGLLGLSLQTLDTIVFIEQAHKREISSIKKISLEPYIITAGKDGIINLWNLNKPTEDPASLNVFSAIETIEYDHTKRKIYAVTEGNQILEILTKEHTLFVKDSLKLNKGLSLTISTERNQLFVGSAENTISIWSLNPLEQIGNIIYIDSMDYIFLDKFNNYKASKPALKRVGLKQQRQILSMMQFDVQFNRPDKVLKAIGSTDTTLITSFRKAYERRIKKLGIDTNAFHQGFSISEANFTNRDNILYEQKDEKLKLTIKGVDGKFKLDRFNIWVNEVPLYGMKGISIRYRNNIQFDTTITISLSQGENRIETSITNVNGTESYRMPLYVKYTAAQPVKEKVHFIGIGINQFADSRRNLQWCVKDIRDLALKFKEKYGAAIIIDTLFDQNVTLSNVQDIKQKLLKTNINDKVIIAYSGHGMLSKQYDYYLSSYNVNFSKPEENGIPYEEIENLLDSIPARKKLLLLDACHSGEVDKDEMITIQNRNKQSASDGIVMHKGSEDETYETKTVGLQNSFELMQSLFVNVGKGTGTTIISAASGVQFAQERGDLQNGIFTFSLLEAMRLNKTIKVSQLKKYVGERVEQLTNGLQKPTTRNELKDFDWELW